MVARYAARQGHPGWHRLPETRSRLRCAGLLLNFPAGRASEGGGVGTHAQIVKAALAVLRRARCEGAWRGEPDGLIAYSWLLTSRARIWGASTDDYLLIPAHPRYPLMPCPECALPTRPTSAGATGLAGPANAASWAVDSPGRGLGRAPHEAKDAAPASWRTDPAMRSRSRGSRALVGRTDDEALKALQQRMAG